MQRREAPQGRTAARLVPISTDISDRFEQAFEQAAPVLVAVRGFGGALGVGHHAKHVAARVEQPGDAIGRPVDRAAVAKGDEPFALDPLERRRIGLEIAVVMRHRQADFGPCRIACVKIERVLSTRSPTVRQVNDRPALRINAPGSSPASVSTWKPLHTPSTGTPLPAASTTACMIGDRAAIAPERR